MKMISNLASMLQFYLLLMSAVVVTSERYIIPESQITEVTIGGTIAQVTRIFSIQDVLEGSHTIVVNHLPLAVDEKSIQITGKGSATVVSTVFENQITYKESDGEYIARIQMLDALSRSIIAFEHKLSQENKTVTARLNAVAQYVEDVVSRNPSHSVLTRIPIDQLAELLDYQEKELKNSNDKVVVLSVVRAAVRDLADKVSALTAALRKSGSYKNDLLLQDLGEVAAFPALWDAWKDLRAQLDALPTALRRWPLSSQTKQLHINIHVSKSDSNERQQQLSFAVEYTVSPASWAVEYDLRVQKNTSPISSSGNSLPYSMRVGLYAVVTQSTGEHWEQVQLHLSTTQAQQRINAPAAPTRLSLDFRSEYVERMYTTSAAAPMRKSAGGPPRVMEMADMAADEVEMEMAGASFTGSSGQVGSPVVFHPEHAINITSDRDIYSASSGGITRKTRLFIREAVLHPAVFSYCVPTKEDRAYMKAWTTGKPVNPDPAQMPLLESHTARVFIEDALTGTTSVQATQPGSPVRVDLGHDKNIQVTSTHILPQKGSRTDDKSTWFVTDKVKYLVENVEYAFSVHSTYDTPQLVVLSEYLPHVGDDGIQVELLQPATTSTLSVIAAGSDSSKDDVWSEQDFIAAVLAHPTLASPAAAAKDDRMQAFVAKGSGNLAWARWVQPGETVRAGLQYKIIWPDGKQVQKNWHHRY